MANSMPVFELRSWAKTHGLKPKTIDKLLSEELDSIESLSLIGTSNVKELGLSFDQRYRLLRALDDLQDESQQQKMEDGDGSSVESSPLSPGRARTASGQSTRRASTQSTADSRIWHPPYAFNTKTHGSNILIEYGNSVARSKNSDSDGIVFSDKPIAVEEIVHLSIVFARNKKVTGGKTMSVGFTSHDPNSIGELPSHCHPNLSQRKGFWLNPIPDKFVRQENVVTFWLTTEGHVLYAINGAQKGLLFSGVDISSSLWATIDIHGRAIGVQIVGDEAVSMARYRYFERHDRVKIRTEVKVSKDTMQDAGISNVTKGTEEAEKWQEFCSCGTEGLVNELHDDGHLSLKITKKREHEPLGQHKTINHGPLAQQVACIDGVGFPRSLVSFMEPEDDIAVGDIVRVVNDSHIVEVSENAFTDMSLFIGSNSAVGQLGVVLGPAPFPEPTLKVKIGQHVRVFKREDVTVKEQRGTRLRGPFGELCQDGFHLFEEDVSRICMDCGKCTENGENCQMKKHMKHSPGRVCGCKDGSSGCVACGRCKSCAEKTGHHHHDASTFEAMTNILIFEWVINALVELFDKQGNSSHGLVVGNCVKVNVEDDEEFQKLQVGHGGYNPHMQKYIREVGRVKRLVASDVVVAFSDGNQWCFNPKALEKVNLSGKVFMEGDRIRFCDDVEKLKALQDGHGGWNDYMNLVPGKTGVVTRVLFNNDLLVTSTGASFRWNPLSVDLVEDHEVPKTVTDRHGVPVSADDVVKIDIEPGTVGCLQHYPKSYLDSLKKEMDIPGVIREIDHDGDLLVYYATGKRLYLKTELVSRQTGVDFDTSGVVEVDDLVRIDSDDEKVKTVQNDAKLWDPGMEHTTGKVGRVRMIMPTGTVLRVDVGGRTWRYASCLVRKEDTTSTCETPGNLSPYVSFARGDRVRIGVDPNKLKTLQEDHGGYYPDMEQSIETGLCGSIMYIDEGGKTWVNFPSYAAAFNPKALEKVHMPDEQGDSLFVGDLVKICKNKKEVKARQHDHGGWVKDMEKVLGKVGRIDDIENNGDVLVQAAGNKWLLHPKNLEHISLQDGQLSWNEADICAPGRHNWKTGKCMVCVKCKQCTDYGPLSPHSSSPLKKPGSVCDCGGSDAGCVDCGKCRSCVGDPPDRGYPEMDLEVVAKIQNLGKF